MLDSTSQLAFAVHPCRHCDHPLMRDPHAPGRPAIYCSRRCAKNSQYKPRPRHRRTCAWCGTQWDAKNHWARACSKDCALKLYYQQHGVRIRARTSQWQRNHPDRIAARNVRALARRRAAKAAAPVFVVTERDLLRLRGRQGGRCFYCADTTRPLTLDHLIPVSRGGGMSIGNLAWACGQCNSSKRDKLPAEFRLYRQRRHALQAIGH